jgi:competence ComEA-like helix-hairpin-helix protein
MRSNFCNQWENDHDETGIFLGRDVVVCGCRRTGCRSDDITVAVAAPAATAAPKDAGPGQAPAGSNEQGGLADINSASAEELDKLPGVGPARAKAIISHRPYSGKDDLAHRKVIPQNVYDQIKDKIIARQASAGAPSGSAGSRSTAAKSK